MAVANGNNILTVTIVALLFWSAQCDEYVVTDFKESYFPTSVGFARSEVLVPAPPPNAPNIDGWDYVRWNTQVDIIQSLPYETGTACIGDAYQASDCRYVTPYAVYPYILNQAVAIRYSFQQHFSQVRIAGRLNRFMTGGDGSVVKIFYTPYTPIGGTPVHTELYSWLLKDSSPIALYNFNKTNIAAGDTISIRVEAGSFDRTHDNVDIDFTVYSDCSIPCDCTHCLINEYQACFPQYCCPEYLDMCAEVQSLCSYFTGALAQAEAFCSQSPTYCVLVPPHNATLTQCNKQYQECYLNTVSCSASDSPVG